MKSKIIGFLKPVLKKFRTSSPDFYGTVEIKGTKHSLYAWKNADSSGTEFISITLREVHKE